MVEDISVEESRLIAVRRAIVKFGNPALLDVQEASTVAAYIAALIDLDNLEDIATADQIVYLLDGLVIGLVTSRLLEEAVPLDQLPKAQEESKRQFQTGIDPVTNEPRVNRNG